MEPSVSATWTASGMFAGALKAALLLGFVSETLGSEFTMTVTGDEVELAPRLSMAVAVRLRTPASALLRATLSEALAVTVNVAGAVRMVLFPGTVIATLGKAFTVIEIGSERSVLPLSFVALATSV